MKLFWDCFCVDVPCTPKSNARKEKVKTPVPAKKPKANCDIRTMFQHMKSKNNETNIGSTIVIDPWLLIIIINIFRYLALSATLYALTSIIPYKKRLSSLQYNVFNKSYFMINLKVSRIRPLFHNFRGDLISRISAVPIFRGIKFRWIGHKTRDPLNLIPTKQIQQRQQ